MNDMLKHLPTLPALDEPTRALFNAIWDRSEARVLEALEQGAKLDQPHPYRTGRYPDEDVAGGLLPLQEACGNRPQKPAQIGIIKALLAHGADPNAHGISEPTETPIGLLCHVLAQNGQQAIDILVDHGGALNIEMVERALTAHRDWVQRTGPVHYLEGTLDALWERMPETEKSRLSVEMMMKIVPDDSQALDYEQIKRVQWLSNHCAPKPAPDLASKLQERRHSPLPGRNGMRLN